jgi:cbb3-type cytochrome c oxidase subunit III
VARAAVPVALAAAAIAISGCSGSSSQENANLVNGKQLFVEKCGTCHILERAGTKGITGPNLDAAFQVARDEGWGDDAISGVVHGQINNASGKMPADLVTGDDAQDVAAYVAAVAAQPGKDGGLLANAVKAPGKAAGGEGAQVFSENCASCHTLAAANANGAVGPVLDDLKPDAARVSTAVTNGKGAMPAFSGQLSPAQIKAVAAFVAESAGK